VNPQRLQGTNGSPKILLFDMDGVLLTPGGYHRALQDTVARLGSALGFSNARLTLEDIHALEACGVTNEWASAAMCLALLALRLWERFPGVEVGPSRLAQPVEAHGLPPPDFAAFIRQMAAAQRAIPEPLARARSLLPVEAHPLIDAAYSVEALSHRVQQEHVLGSRTFARTYRLPAVWDVPSYLLAYDRSNLSPALHMRLAEWLARPEQRAVVFTNRPSTAPDGVFCTPEAELGARLVGVEGIPLVGGGGVMWLAAQRGVPQGTFHKPHPVHALAALGRALGDSLTEAFVRAAELALERRGQAGWARLEGAQVWVFEDSTGGLESLKAAQRLLAARGISMQVHLIGVSDSPPKRAALEQAGARVYDTLEEAWNAVTRV